jgi:6-phosphogluconolactonase/glucosamine-6-phosphate isomerase/deaminase
MNLSIKTTTRPIEAASFIALSVLNQLRLGKQVLLFLAGGSSIAVGVKIAELLRKSSDENLIKNLTITLTDERYGPLDHADSNWHQLKEKGFNLPGAKLIFVLNGEDRATVTEKFNYFLHQEFKTNKETKYRIGLFGIGADGHTAGILPESDAIFSKDLAFSYDTPTFSRITITPKIIEQLNEAVIWAQGEDKWSIIENLREDIAFAKQPAQILKRVPLLTIFTDYSNNI